MPHSSEPADPPGFSSAPFIKRLVFGVLLLNGIVAVLAALSLQQSYRHYEKQAVVTTQNLARALEQDLRASFDKVDLAVSSVKDEAERQLASGHMQGARLDAYISRQLSRQPDLKSIRVIGSDGRVLYGTGITANTNVSMADRPHFLRLRREPKSGLVVSEPIVGKISGKWSLVFTRRIDAPDGTFAGAVFAVILLEQFQQKFAKLDLGRWGVLSLRDLDLGTVVRHPEPSTIGSAIGTKTHSAEWPKRLKENPLFGTYFAVGLDGRNRALSFQRVSGYPFYIVAGLDPGDYLMPWNQELWKTLSLVGAFLSLTIVFSWLIVRLWKHREADARTLIELSQLALRRSEEQLELALNSAAMGIWVWSRDTGQFTANLQAKRLHGIADLETVTLEAILASVASEDRAQIAAALTTAAPSDIPLQLDLRTVHPSGQSFWLSWRGKWIRDAHGEFRILTGVVHDITDVKTSEQRKDHFLATLAHELRNPLAPIRNALQIMRLSTDKPVIERARHMMERQLENLVHLVEDLGDVSRIAQGKLKLAHELIDIETVVSNAIETSRPVIEAARHDLSIEAPAEKVLVNGDAPRLAQVLSNLLNNAARYTPDGGRIALQVSYTTREVSVTVKDNGIGIPQDMLPHIFDMFTQIDASVGRSQGLGIGLALVKQLVELHGGTVRGFSEGRGHGSEFTMTLPVAAIDARGAEPTMAGNAPPPREKIKRKVLIVDDNRDSAHSLAMMFQLMGHSTATAYDGEEAVAVADRFMPEVVLLDIGLPKMDGFEAARRIRQLPQGNTFTLVALTGWAQEADHRLAREAGFDHYIVKPAERLHLEQLFK